MGMNKLLMTVTMGLLLTASNTGFGQAQSMQAKAAGQPGRMQAGYVVVPVKDAQGREHLAVEPYYPQPGDIMLYDFHDKWVDLACWFVGSGPPNHAAIVIDRPDGKPAILEIGANSRPQAFTQAYIVEVQARLEMYPGAVMIRSPRQPLSAEQREHLRNWSVAQDNKKFAVGRLALQGTPFNCRKGLRYMLFAHTYLDRDRWICSENVVAAATVAGLLDPKKFPANAMYPRDLCYDEQYNLSAIYQAPVLWVAEPKVQIDGDRVTRVVKEHAPLHPSQLPLVDMTSFNPPQHTGAIAHSAP
jgi:hypothetical protein